MKRHALTAALAIGSAIAYALPLIAQEAGEADAHAEGGDQGALLLQPDHGTALYTLLLFIGLVLVLGRFVWPRITQGLDAREARIRDDIESARRANDQAQATLADYEQKLAAAHAEARQLIDAARSDGDKVRQRMLTETETEIARLRDRAADQIEQAKQAAVADIYARTADLAVAVAGKILQRQINEQDTQQLVEQSLAELRSLRNSN